MHICRKRAQVIVRQLVPSIASAEDVLNFSGLQQCLELFREIRLAMRDVHVADDEDVHLGNIFGARCKCVGQRGERGVRELQPRA